MGKSGWRARLVIWKCSHFLNIWHNTMKLCRIINFDLFFSFLEIMLHIILGVTVSRDPLLPKVYSGVTSNLPYSVNSLQQCSLFAVFFQLLKEWDATAVKCATRCSTLTMTSKDTNWSMKIWGHLYARWVSGSSQYIKLHINSAQVLFIWVQ